MAMKRKAAAKGKAKGAKVRMVRVVRPIAGAAAIARAAAPAVDPSVPVATIASAGGPVTLGISFGQAQHGKYTIQLFDPGGTTELVRQSGVNTDAIADQFTLQATPAQLDGQLVQWSGLISAFSPAPGQQFSLTFDVTQNGVGVPGGRVPRAGALNTAQPFIGLLRLVTR